MAMASETGGRNSLALRNAALFLCMALVSLAWASTTELTYAVLTLARNVFILLLLVLLVFVLVGRPGLLGGGAALFGGFLLLGFYSWTIFQVHAPGASSDLVAHIIWITLSSAIAMTIYAAPLRRPVMTDQVARAFIYFSLGVAGLTLLLGGLQIQGVPRFVYDRVTAEGAAIGYSQGISKFYGLAAVLSALVFTRHNVPAMGKLLYFGLMCGFLTLSLFGGGRGDFVAALLLCAAALGSLRVFLAIVGLLLGFTFFEREIMGLLATDETYLFERYRVLTYSLGMRDILLFDSFQLLAEKPGCLFFGCGVGFFQAYFGYPMSQYPHNVPVESLISFGLVVMVPVTLMLLRGLWSVYLREGYRSNFLFVFAFFFIVGLKSGTIITSFLLIGSIAYLCLRGFNEIGSFKTVRIER